jgi:hypothetical protein
MWGNQHRCTICNKLGGTDGYCKLHRPSTTKHNQVRPIPAKTIDQLPGVEEQHGRVYHKLRDNYMEGYGHGQSDPTLLSDKFEVVSDTYPLERRR